MSDTPRSEPEREGESLDESLAALFADGLIEPMRDENGEVVYRNGQPVWVASERAAKDFRPDR